VDQYSDDPQSWNLYTYARNNPLKFLDPSGRDCVYTNNASNGTVGLERGDSCSQQGGTYVSGTVDAKSFTYDAKTNSIGYTYSNAAEGTGGAGSIGLPNAPTREELGLLALNQAGNRASRDVSTSALLIGGFATSYASTYAIPAVIAGLAAMGETGAVGPGVGLLKLAQKYGLNANSPKTRQLLENLNVKVEDFVGKYRLGSIKNAEGWKFDGMTVKEALDAGARKLLTDGRFDK
jgi:hypothetical protein